MDSYKNITKDNLVAEHICCGFSDKKAAEGYQAKKDMIAGRLDDGFKFLKLDERGKIFIEYVPAEYAWAPVNAPGYNFIHCFWVSGKFKGHGHARELLRRCEEDSAGKKGLAVITTKKNMPFFTEKKFFEKMGFTVSDSAPPYFELLVKKFSKAPDPRFNEAAKNCETKNNKGLTIYYSNLCPFTEYYSKLVKDIAEENGLKVHLYKTDSLEKAKNLPVAAPVFAMFLDGGFITHEIPSEKKLRKLLNL